MILGRFLLWPSPRRLPLALIEILAAVAHDDVTLQLSLLLSCVGNVEGFVKV